jgi:alpha-1,3-glucan synthase
LYNETGYAIQVSLPNGCHDSEFNQFGEIEAFGLYPPWQRQLAKFAGTQDRLTEWKPSVQQKLVNFACLVISMLDVDGFRIDKATQVTLDYVAQIWAPQVRDCARKLGKNNFFLPGEITAKIDLGAAYVGRGIQKHNRKTSPAEMYALAPDTFMRQTYAFDSGAFHYSVYRTMLSFLGLFGNIDSELPIDPVAAWNRLFTAFDFYNHLTGEVDPRDMFGITNQDTFRWPSLNMGAERLRLGLMVTTILLPGIPLVISFWG